MEYHVLECDFVDRNGVLPGEVVQNASEEERLCEEETAEPEIVGAL
jgi:hypothetical protein